MIETRRRATQAISCAYGRSLAYRFGRADHIEMERVATEDHPFGIVLQGTSPHTYQTSLWFSIGAYTYCVAEAGGQAHGIFLTVVEHGKVVRSMYSGESFWTTGLANLKTRYLRRLKDDSPDTSCPDAG